MHQKAEIDLLVLALLPFKLNEARMAAMWAFNSLLAIEDGKGYLRGGNHKWYTRGHARVGFFDVKMLMAFRTPMILHRFNHERLNSHHGIGNDGSAMTTSGHLAGTMFSPEEVDNFRPLIC